MSSGDISTWSRTKDVLLIGAACIGMAALARIMVDVSEMKTQLAVYQANVAALKEDHERLRTEVYGHVREDRERFKVIPGGRN